MFKPIEACIGLRYMRAKRRTRFISFITLTSILGIALGVTALITVLSVMNGFEQELRQRILGMTSHATVSGWDGKLRDWKQVANLLDDFPQVIGHAPFAQGQVMLNLGQRVSGVLLRGIDPEQESQVSDLPENMVPGKGQITDLKPGEYGIILGAELANYLGAIQGDKVTVITPQLNVTPGGILPRLRRFTVVGIFKVGMFEYDRNLAVVHIADAARLMRLGNAVSGLRLQLDDMFEAPAISSRLRQHILGQYRISDWTQAHRNFFRAIKMEKRVMFIILLLIVAVAAFNIVSTLVMVVTDKRPDIAILRTQGLTARQVMWIFILLGGMIGVAGTILGVCGGVLLASNIENIVPMVENFLGTKLMAPDVYYISDLPSRLLWSDVYKIAGIGIFLSLLATLYPAWQAARVNPAEVLRYE
ncbi:MAG TPA: lipoprotein-releasing ABC transporter permease subunit [Crenotrichaceae bacterium]|nr:lipoprotein-releasing ABC transporter permease subunit [Crenotrichaceae bacterium]